MSYSFTISEDYKVIVTKDGEKIDEVGPFESAESATYWGEQMTEKYSENPKFVYPGEEANGSTM